MWLFKGNRCSCLPTYTPGGGGTPTCPDTCLQAASIIYPTEEGLDCSETVVIDLSLITNAGNCTCGVTYSVESSSMDYTLVGSTLTIENDLTTGAGQYHELVYRMECDCDVRSIIGTISVFANGTC